MTLNITMVIPGMMNDNDQSVVLPLKFSKTEASVTSIRVEVMDMVRIELCVMDASCTTPSPQSNAVEVNAMIQNGHLGNNANRSQETAPVFLDVEKSLFGQWSQVEFIMDKLLKFYKHRFSKIVLAHFQEIVNLQQTLNSMRGFQEMGRCLIV